MQESICFFGAGNPNGVQEANLGWFWYDTTGNVLWVKTIDADTSGWVRVTDGAAGTDLTDTATQTIQSSQGDWRKLPVLGQGGTLTLGTTAAVAGDQITITRTDVSAFTYAIVNGGAGAGTLLTMPVSKICSAKFQFDGTNWALRDLGQLA